MKQRVISPSLSLPLFVCVPLSLTPQKKKKKTKKDHQSAERGCLSEGWWDGASERTERRFQFFLGVYEPWRVFREAENIAAVVHHTLSRIFHSALFHFHLLLSPSFIFFFLPLLYQFFVTLLYYELNMSLLNVFITDSTVSTFSIVLLHPILYCTYTVLHLYIHHLIQWLEKCLYNVIWYDICYSYSDNCRCEFG